jgi:hypothetical protein
MYIHAPAIVALFMSAILAESSVAYPTLRSGENEKTLDQRIDKEVREYRDWRESFLRDPDRIRELRKGSGDKQFDSGYGSGPSSARVTLAKLGDEKQFKKIVCEVYSNHSKAQLFAINKLAEIGGYASIKALADAMLNNPPMKPMSAGDSFYLPLRTYILRSLTGLVPEMEVPAMARYVAAPISDEQAREWYNWIMEHRDQLGRLEPNGAVELDPASCAELNKRKHSAVKSAKRP